MTLCRLSWRGTLRVWALAASAAVALAGALPARAQVDADSRTVLGYTLTLQRLEACAAALQDVATWLQKHPAEAAALRSQARGETSLAAAAARFEREPAIKAVLDKHQLSGLDFAVAPLALKSSYAVVMAAKHVVVMPPDRVNASAVAMIKANPARVEQLIPAINANLRTLRSDN